MRTTLELDDDLLSAAKELARKQRVTVGQVISDLARRSLNASIRPKTRNGVPLFNPSSSKIKSNMRLVNALRDEQ